MVSWWWLPVAFVVGAAVPIGISWAVVWLDEYQVFRKQDYPH